MSSKLLSPEARLVLLADGSGEVSEEVRALLREPLDWPTVMSLAERERSILPLWRTVRATAAALDRPELQVLRHLAAIWEFKLVHLERLLFELLGLFREAGIETVLLKGAGLGAAVHRDFTRRPMLDLDLLVGEGRAEEAWSLARSKGWRWQADRYPLESYGHAHHLPPLTDAFSAGVALEIHTDLWMPDHPFGLTEQEVWSEARILKVRGETVRVPSLEHQLLHCCIHFAWSHRARSHAWRTFHDVRALTAKGMVEWDRLIRAARASGGETYCYWTLRLSATAIGTEVPDEVLSALRPSRSRLLLDRLERHFMLNLMPNAAGCPSVAVEKLLWKLAFRDGGSGGIPLPSDRAQATFPQRIAHQAHELGTWMRYLARLA